MDLSSLEAAATTSRHAVVLFGTGAGIAACLAYYFAVQKHEGKRLHLQLAAAILAICGAGATALNFHYTDEISRETDRLAKAKDDELERFKLEKDTEIQNLEKGKLILREQVGVLEKSNLKAAKEVATLQIEVAAARRRQAEAETRLAKVAKSQEPRNQRIQSDLIVSRLKTAPRGKAMVLYPQADPESLLFAISLQMALQNAGWQNMGFKAVPSTIEHGASNGDIDFVMRDPLSGFRSESVQALLEALKESGFTVGGGFGDPKIQDDTLRIVIQPKP